MVALIKELVKRQLNPTGVFYSQTLILLYVFLFLEASLMLRIMVTQSLLFKPYTDTSTDAKRYLELSVKLK